RTPWSSAVGYAWSYLAEMLFKCGAGARYGGVSHRSPGGIVRTSWFLLPLALLALVACSDPLAGLPNESPPSITLVASRLEGEAAFDVTFSAHTSDPDGNRLTYSWRVDGELITQATGPT